MRLGDPDRGSPRGGAVIVFSRNGRTAVTKGWRSRFFILALCFATALMLVLLVFFLPHTPAQQPKMSLPAIRP